MKRLTCPDCGRKGVTRRTSLVESEDRYACSHCHFEAFTGGMTAADVDGCGRLFHANKAADLPRSYLFDAAKLAKFRAEEEGRTLGSVWLAPGETGAHVLRLRTARIDGLSDQYEERWDVLTDTGGATTWAKLPADSRRIWPPAEVRTGTTP